MKSFLPGIGMWIDRLTSFLRTLGQIALLVMMVTICYDAIMRYVFAAPTLWSLELNTMLVLFVTVIPAGEVLRSNMQLRITFFTDRMGKRVRGFLDALASLAGVLFCGFMVWKGLAMAMHAFKYGERMSTAIGTPFVVPYMLIPIGFGVMCLQYVLKFAQVLVAQEKSAPLAEPARQKL